MIKRIYNFFIKKNNIILNDDESYNSISNKILKKYQLLYKVCK